MRSRIIKTGLLLMTALLIITGCANPLRQKSQCEILCEQMHGECTAGCPADYYDPTCYPKCDTYRDCKETCDKPLYREGDETEDKEESDK